MRFREFELGSGQDRGRVVALTLPDDFNLMGFFAVPSAYLIFGTGESATTVQRHFYFHQSDEPEAQNILAYIGSDVDSGDRLTHLFEVEAPPLGSELFMTMEERAKRASGRK